MKLPQFNLCTKLLLPLLKLDNKWLDRVNNKKRRLVNCYINWPGKFELENNLLVIINNFQSTDFNEKTDEMECHPLCSGTFDIFSNDSTYTVYIYLMDSFEDYFKFIDGKYSEYSDSSYNLCVEKGINTFERTQVKHVLDKSDALRKVIEEKYNLSQGQLIDTELAPLWNQSEIKNYVDQSLIDCLKLTLKNSKVKEEYKI
jgi:hypothetical protein